MWITLKNQCFQRFSWVWTVDCAVGGSGLPWKKSIDFGDREITRNACITNPLVVHGLSIGIKILDECFDQGFESRIGYRHLAELER